MCVEVDEGIETAVVQRMRIPPMTQQEPWRRISNPVDLPAFSGAADLRVLDAEVFECILRDHLIPRSSERKYNAHWRNFWNVLAFDDELADRATAILEDFVDQAKAALDAEELDDKQQGRARKFIDKSVMALDRIDKAEDAPLAWIGERAAQFNPRSREVIEKLVQAIAEHRKTLDNENLWRVLRLVGLDPDAR
ncbi:hypothetical protein ACKAMS_24440 [Rhodococcus sp. 5A-K4]